jgi:hypothetical protein
VARASARFASACSNLGLFRARHQVGQLCLGLRELPTRLITRRPLRRLVLRKQRRTHRDLIATRD